MTRTAMRLAAIAVTCLLGGCLPSGHDAHQHEEDAGWEYAQPVSGGSVERCGNGEDDDDDGRTDEKCGDRDGGRDAATSDSGSPCDICDPLPPSAEDAGVSRCCTQDGGCGLDTPLSSECLPLGAPGNIDLACPDFELPAGLTWAGCCTAGGRCGAFGVSAGLGCIDNAALGAPEASCAYESSNTCQAILVVTCDGSEDCPAGHQCCGEWNSAYRRLLCIEGTCPQAQATASAVWSEICHPGDTCTQRGFECRRAPTLPYGIYRCRDTGEPAVGRVSTARDELNCGSVVCGAGQTCCVPEPGEPHCVSAGEPCRCTPMPPTDARDAGPDEDAG